MKENIHLAIIQLPPVYWDKRASMAKAREYIRAAASGKAELIIFGETWLSGYPAWLDYCPEMALWDHSPTKKVFAQMYLNSISVPGPETEQLSELAREHQVVIGMGINEVKPDGPANGTIFNAFILFDKDGSLLIHHRKLMPTFTEKLIYGLGDAHGLKVAETSLGRIGGLICWEHWMPLARHTLHLQGEHIHLALWPRVHELLQVASRSYAFEARSFVVAAGQIMRVKDIPEGLQIPRHLVDHPDTFLLNGGSCVFGPDGKVLLEPQFDQERIIYFTLENIGQLYGERMALDVSGHYNRPDIFSFGVRQERQVS